MAKKESLMETILKRRNAPKDENAPVSRIQYAKEPKKISATQHNSELLREILRRQKANHKLEIEESEVKIRLSNTEPMIGIHVSDVHFGSDAVDYKMMMEVLEFALSQENAFVTLYGDLAEGLKAEHLDTNVLHLLANPTQQLFGFREIFIRPLAEQGKLAGMVAQFKSHEEWLRQYSGFNPYAVLADLGPNTTVAVLKNGGLMHLVFPDGQVQVFQCSHNLGGGSSQLDPVGAQRKSASGHPKHVDAAVQGHLHSLGGTASKEVNSVGLTRVYIQLGAFKGNTDENADGHAVRDMGGRKSGPPAYFTIHTTRDGKRDMYPVPTMADAELLYQAATLYELAVQQDAVGHYVSRIQTEVERHPKLSFVPSKSRRRIEDDESSKNWTTVHYGVDTKLPLTAMVAAGYRQGSATADKEALQELVKFVDENNHVVLMNGRQMIDTGLPASPDREREFWKLLNILKPLWEDPKRRVQEGDIKMLAWLFDGIMRSEHWKKPKKRDRGGKLTNEDSNGFYPGNVIIQQAGVPLLDNQGTIRLSMPSRKVTYDIMNVDAQAGSGSHNNPFRGLVTLEQRQPDRKDVVFGGDMPGGGFMTRWNSQSLSHQVMLPPGWLAREHTKGGKRNRGRPTPGPMGVTLLPDRKAVFPSSSLSEAEYWHMALVLLYGMNELGGYDTHIRALRKGGKAKR